MQTVSPAIRVSLKHPNRYMAAGTVGCRQQHMFPWRGGRAGRKVFEFSLRHREWSRPTASCHGAMTALPMKVSAGGECSKRVAVTGMHETVEQHEMEAHQVRRGCYEMLKMEESHVL